MNIRRGFSIVELIVILAIVSVLATVVIGNLSNTRKEARDRERIANLQMIAVALRMYKDQYGTYPAPGCGNEANTCWTGATFVMSAGTSCSNPSGVACNSYIHNFNDFMAQLPVDSSVSGNKGYIYTTTPDRSEAKIMSYKNVESETITSSTHEFARYDSSCTNQNYGANSGNRDTYAISLDKSPGDGSGVECW